jgi:hypothetical protein
LQDKSTGGDLKVNLSESGSPSDPQKVGPSEDKKSTVLGVPALFAASPTNMSSLFAGMKDVDDMGEDDGGTQEDSGTAADSLLRSQYPSGSSNYNGGGDGGSGGGRTGIGGANSGGGEDTTDKKMNYNGFLERLRRPGSR